VSHSFPDPSGSGGGGRLRGIIAPALPAHAQQPPRGAISKPPTATLQWCVRVRGSIGAAHWPAHHGCALRAILAAAAGGWQGSSAPSFCACASKRLRARLARLAGVWGSGSARACEASCGAVSGCERLRKGLHSDGLEIRTSLRRLKERIQPRTIMRRDHHSREIQSDFLGERRAGVCDDVREVPQHARLRRSCPCACATPVELRRCPIRRASMP